LIYDVFGDTPLEPIATKFGNSLNLTEVINRSKFGDDWNGSFGFGVVQHLPFLIGTKTGSYHCSATALARDVPNRNKIYCYVSCATDHRVYLLNSVRLRCKEPVMSTNEAVVLVLLLDTGKTYVLS